MKKITSLISSVVLLTGVINFSTSQIQAVDDSWMYSHSNGNVESVNPIVGRAAWATLGYVGSYANQQLEDYTGRSAMGHAVDFSNYLGRQARDYYRRW